MLLTPMAEVRQSMEFRCRDAPNYRLAAGTTSSRLEPVAIDAE
jgi:hypothetical protein